MDARTGAADYDASSSSSSSSSSSYCVGGAIVVVAKCPLAGSCKTRLVPLLGEEGAACLARAMLSDVLTSISECPPLGRTLKVLLYAPGTEKGEAHMASILRALGMPYVIPSSRAAVAGGSSSSTSIVPLPVLRTVLANNGWVLLPVSSSSSSSSDLADASADAIPPSSDLGGILADALDRTRGLLADVAASSSSSSSSSPSPDSGAVLFLGMDSPELPMEEVVHGLRISSSGRKRGGEGFLPPPRRTNGGGALLPDDGGENGGSGCEMTSSFVIAPGKAHLCPANDGGYGLLSVPRHAPSIDVFSGVRWSQPLAAMSQLKALTDRGVDVSVGALMFDVDEPEDVRDLVARLVIGSRRDEGGEEGEENSDRPPPPGEGRGGGDSLTRPSSGIGPAVTVVARRCFPRHTWRTLIDLNVIRGE